MKVHENFHGIYSWKLQLMEAVEASTSTDIGKFRVHLWTLPLTSMEVNLLLPTKMEISMKKIYFHRLPWKCHGSKFASMEVSGNFHRSRSKSNIMWRARPPPFKKMLFFQVVFIIVGVFAQILYVFVLPLEIHSRLATAPALPVLGRVWGMPVTSSKMLARLPWLTRACAVCSASCFFHYKNEKKPAWSK